MDSDQRLLTEPPPSRARRLLLDSEWLTYSRYLWSQRRASILAAPFRLVQRMIRLRNTPQEDGAYSHLENVTASVPPRYFFSADDVPGIARFCRETFPGRVDEIIRSADRVVGGTFEVFGRLITSSETLTDPEQRFYINRWYHGITLAKASAYTGSEKYAETFIRLFSNWLGDHPLSPKSETWESYSVSERITNWLLAHHLFSRSKTYHRDAAKIVLAELRRHADYLANHLETHVIHNHLINNARALFLYGIACRDTDAEATRYINLGWSILREQLPRQVSPDGFLREQSSHYHLLVLSRYAEAFLLARANGIQMAVESLDALRKMFEVAGRFIRPDGSLVLIGDVSPDLAPDEVLELMALSTNFGGSVLVRPNERSVWFSGLEEVAGEDRDQSTGGTSTFAGNVIHSTAGIHFVFRCDSEDVIRHGHDDGLSFDLWVDGRQLVVDPGNPTFVPNSWGLYFRGALGHNSVTVDDVPPSIRSATIRALTAPEYPRPTSMIERVESHGRGVNITARHSRYHRLRKAVDIRRYVSLDDAGVLQIRDVIEGEGVHKVRICLHLGSEAAKVERSGVIVEVKDEMDRKILNIDFKSAASLSVEVRDDFVSPRYGVIVPAKIVACSVETTLPVVIETTLGFGKQS